MSNYRTKRKGDKMKTGYTPGPWEARKDRISYHIAKRAENGSLSMIADLEKSIFPIASEANARLIASAPDLLAALEALYTHCAMVHNIWGDGCNQKEADAAIVAGLSAIQKAKGG